MGDDLKSKTVRGLKWTSVDSVAQNVFQVVVMLILANLLEVEDFGVIAVLTIFVNLANLFQDSGFGMALTRKKEVTDKEYSSVFYFSLTISLILYLILFFSVNLISEFQGRAVPVVLARVLFLTFFVSSFATVPYVVLSREVDYRSIAYTNLFALCISNGIAILLAFLNYGAWAICIQTLLYHTCRVVGLWYFSRWKPLLYFSFQPLKEMFPIGFKSMLTYVSYTIANNLSSNIIDKNFNRIEAGYYSQASRWYNKPILFFTNPINGLSLPVISKVNDDMERQKRIFRKMIRTMSFVVFPLTFIFALVTPEFVLIFLREKWEAVVPYMQLLCIGGVFVPFDTLLFNLVNSNAKAGTLFIFSIVKNILVIGSILISIQYGIITMIIASGVINYIFFFSLSGYCCKLLKCSFIEYAKDTFPYFVLSLLLVIVTQWIFRPVTNIYISFLLKGMVPILLYLAVMYYSKSEIMMEGIGYVNRYIKRKLNNDKG